MLLSDLLLLLLFLSLLVTFYIPTLMLYIFPFTSFGWLSIISNSTGNDLPLIFVFSWYFWVNLTPTLKRKERNVLLKLAEHTKSRKSGLNTKRPKKGSEFLRSSPALTMVWSCLRQPPVQHLGCLYKYWLWPQWVKIIATLFKSQFSVFSAHLGYCYWCIEKKESCESNYTCM